MGEKDSKICGLIDLHLTAQQHIDWPTFKKSTDMLSNHRHLFILKHLAGIAATGRNMVRRKERMTGECPRCGINDEHTEHIILCPDTTAESTFSQAVEDIGSWLRQTTDQAIGEAIKELI